jgi:hypothetical protein
MESLWPSRASRVNSESWDSLCLFAICCRIVFSGNRKPTFRHNALEALFYPTILAIFEESSDNFSGLVNVAEAPRPCA